MVETPHTVSAEERAAQEAANDRLRKLRDQDAADKGANKEIGEALKQFIGFILKLIFGDEDAPHEESPGTPPVPLHERVIAAANFVDSAALPEWKKFQEEHRGEAVNHINPVKGDAVVTSGKGPRNTGIAGASRNHQGIDIDVTQGEHASIKASAKGVVVFAGVMNGYGNTVVIGHGDGTQTLYAHMTGEHMPKMAQRVEQGDVIGDMGNTTNGKIANMAVHLHYEQIAAGQRITPRINGVEMHKGASLEGHPHDHGIEDLKKPQPTIYDLPTDEDRKLHTAAPAAPADPAKQAGQALAAKGCVAAEACDTPTHGLNDALAAAKKIMSAVGLG